MSSADVAEAARRAIAQHAHKAVVLVRAASRGEPVDVDAIEQELLELDSATQVLRGIVLALRADAGPA